MYENSARQSNFVCNHSIEQLHARGTYIGMLQRDNKAAADELTNADFHIT